MCLNFNPPISSGSSGVAPSGYFILATPHHSKNQRVCPSRFPSAWGSIGKRDGEFDPDGKFLLSFGAQGDGGGEFERPTDVAVDTKGNIYVVD